MCGIILEGCITILTLAGECLGSILKVGPVNSLLFHYCDHTFWKEIEYVTEDLKTYFIKILSDIL